MKTLTKIMTISAFAVTVTIAALAGEKGGEKLTGARPNFDPGTAPKSVHSDCGKCVKSSYSYVDFSSRGAVKERKPVTGTMAPGCEDRIVAVGHGKAKVDKIEHRCGGVLVANSACCKN